MAKINIRKVLNFSEKKKPSFGNSSQVDFDLSNSKTYYMISLYNLIIKSTCISDRFLYMFSTLLFLCIFFLHI